MAFWRCYYHVVWATKGREPIITASMEQIIAQAAIKKSQELDSPVQAINSVADHVHVAVCIPPKIAVADWVRNIKGITAHEINTMFPDLQTHFRWQRGYGVLTFGAKMLPTITRYIERQKEHHAANTVESYLEQIE
jgi:putative transposase